MVDCHGFLVSFNSLHLKQLFVDSCDSELCLAWWSKLQCFIGSRSWEGPFVTEFCIKNNPSLHWIPSPSPQTSTQLLVALDSPILPSWSFTSSIGCQSELDWTTFRAYLTEPWIWCKPIPVSWSSCLMICKCSHQLCQDPLGIVGARLRQIDCTRHDLGFQFKFAPRQIVFTAHKQVTCTAINSSTKATVWL